MAAFGSLSLDATLAQPLQLAIGFVQRLMPQLSYYTIVSALALGVDLGVFAALTRSDLKASLAGVVGYAIGLVLHYALSVRFVFETEGCTKSDARRFAEFVASGGVGILITGAVIAIATDLLHLPAMLGKVAAVGTSFFIVFLLRRGVVFATAR